MEALGVWSGPLDAGTARAPTNVQDRSSFGRWEAVMRISDETILAMRRCVVGATVLVGGSVGLASVVSAADDGPDATTTSTAGETTEPGVTATTFEVASTNLGVLVEEAGVVVPTTVDVTTPGESNPPVPLDPDDCPGCGLG